MDNAMVGQRSARDRQIICTYHTGKRTGKFLAGQTDRVRDVSTGEKE